MALIFETENFLVESHEKPEVDRLDGGHIVISPRVAVIDRTQLSPELAIEVMRLTIVVGKAFIVGMGKRGVHIGRINYQDNGNWKPQFHIHLYGRALDAKQQKYGNPIIPGHKDSYNPLTNEDIQLIKEEITSIFKLPEFQNDAWRI